MRIFANLFLTLFLTDGMLSLLDEITSLAFSLHLFSGVRSVVANLVFLMAIPLYLCLGIDKRLPKRVFLPLTLFVLWCPVAITAFPSLAESGAYRLLLPAVQLLLCLVPVSCFRTARFQKKRAHRLVMPKEPFEAPFFSLKNSVTFFAANLVAVPLVVALLLFNAANAYLTEHTAGFMHLAPDGLHMVERDYRRGNKTVRLVAMIHVGEKAYYDQLSDAAVTGRTIVLAEGVTDDRHLLKNGLDYGKLAGVLGLSSQRKMQLKGRLIDEAELEEAGPATSDAGENAAEADILRADVDISSFRPPTIRFLDEFGRQLKNNPSVMKGLLAFNGWAEKNMTAKMYDTLMNDILYNRNRVVIGHLKQAIARYDTVVIPWGALHMPEIERAVRKQGFRLQQEDDRVSIDLRKVVGKVL